MILQQIPVQGFQVRLEITFLVALIAQHYWSGTIQGPSFTQSLLPNTVRAWDASLLRMRRAFPLTPWGITQAVPQGWRSPEALDLSHCNAKFPPFKIFLKFFLKRNMYVHITACKVPSPVSKGSVPVPSKQRTLEQCPLPRDQKKKQPCQGESWQLRKPCPW